MLSMTLNSFGASMAVAISLFFWRITYPTTDWAVLCLLPLTTLLFSGSYRARSAVNLVSAKVAVRGDSPLAWLMAGRLRASLGSMVFILIAVPLLAWQAISSSYTEILLLATVCLFAAMLFAWTQSMLQLHLTPPFARTAALSVSTWVAAALFLPVLAWTDWHFTSLPNAIRISHLIEAIQIGMDQVPARRSWVAEILSVPYALEYAKLWFVVQAESPRWFTFWYSIDTAPSVLWRHARAVC